MIIDYNQYHGSRKLEQFLKLHNKNKQFVTTTSNKKEKKLLFFKNLKKRIMKLVYCYLL